MTILLYIYSLILGLCFGSFANVVIFRLPLGKSVIKPPSACGACNTRLKPADLVPIISYLCLSGKCKYCSAIISKRYSITELLVGLLFLGMTWRMPSLQVIPLLGFIFVLVCISFIDMDTQEIPDILIIWGMVFASILLLFNYIVNRQVPNLQYLLISVLVGGLPLFLLDRLTLFLLKKDGFGYGDVKLMVMASLFLGWELTIVAFIFGFVSGGFFAMYLVLSKKAERGSYMAFGPFLAIGIVAALWFGENFMQLLM